jgi:hypothetical protein
MEMIHNYEKFCKYYDCGRVTPDVRSDLGNRSVQYLRRQGWDIRGGFFRRSQTVKDLLALCRQSEENFQLAYKHGGIDFWLVKE